MEKETPPAAEAVPHFCYKRARYTDGLRAWVCVGCGK